MGIFNALFSAVGGLQAQSFALENISGNIANSQTVGYKRLDTSFQDLISSDASTVARQFAGSVLARSQATNSIQGAVQSTAVDTNIAINGEGFFVVSSRIGDNNGQPIFSGTDLYTRRGDFDLDNSGFLVNGGGYYLQALPLDPSTGNPQGSTPEAINVGAGFLAAEATTTIEYRANLASFPRTTDADSDVADSELLDPADFTNDPTTGGAGTVIGSENTLFLENSIAGGSITAFDSNGTPVDIQLRWAKTSNTSPETWNLFYQNDASATGTDVGWTNVGADYEFDASGTMTSSTNTVTVNNLTVRGLNLGNITLSHGSSGLTQFDDSNGVARITDLTQNGSPAGELVDVSIEDGRIIANYSNNRSQAIAQIPLAVFNAPNQLKLEDGGAFSANTQSGQATLGGTGSITGNAVEASNTDIASEFSKLIVTQQAYTANTRVVTTTDEMLSEITNIIR
ncbi:flagellar hook protein FlgE [Coralliovum pocilloporae]|uniref:flagellar hook protein FlgE n=1 Tax=Coralliovum pocilloporae TaxID=3066369 RepID=UPI003306DD58